MKQIRKWRTTKIPSQYFIQIEEILKRERRFVSVSNFIRLSIQEKLQKESSDFLLLKDLVFNETRILQIHDLIVERFTADSKELMNLNLNRIIEESLDLELYSFLSKFLKSFAKYHPFKDGNKRTALVVVDSFLRLRNLKLKLKAEKGKETADEIFFWQNSNQQKSLSEIKEYLITHVITHISRKDIDEEMEDSIKENKLMLMKLSR